MLNLFNVIFLCVTHIINISEPQADLSVLVFAENNLAQPWTNLCPPDAHVSSSHRPYHATHTWWHSHLLLRHREEIFLLILVCDSVSIIYTSIRFYFDVQKIWNNVSKILLHSFTPTQALWYMSHSWSLLPRTMLKT